MKNYPLINFDSSFSSSDRFFFTECLYGYDSEITLNNLRISNIAESITSEGIEFNTKYFGYMEYVKEDNTFVLEATRTNTTNYISSNMADEEKIYIKKNMLIEFCENISGHDF